MPRYRFEVDQFLGHFVSQAEDISKVISPFHRKMLYASAFDPLARAAYGKSGTQGERFVRLIRDVAKWPDRLIHNEKGPRRGIGAALSFQHLQGLQVQGLQRHSPLAGAAAGLVSTVGFMGVLLGLPSGESVYNPSTMVRSQAV